MFNKLFLYLISQYYFWVNIINRISVFDPKLRHKTKNDVIKYQTSVSTKLIV